MDKISVVITAVSGEEKNLERNLSSIKKFADEIVVVDMSDGNGITAVAKKFKAQCYKHKLINYVEPVRNFGISKTTNEWILILDPDEEITEKLIKRLKEIIIGNEADYVRIPRKNIVFGKVLRHSRWWPDMNIRFFKKGSVNWDETIHSVPMTEGRGMDLDAKDELAIVHHHYESIEQFIERMNRYTSIQAKNKSENHKFHWKDLIVKPASEFLSRFFQAEGYRDGIHGLALSLLQSFYELVVYLKIWQIQGFKDDKISVEEVIDEMNIAKREFNYWQNDALVKEKGSTIARIKRKFRI